MALAPHDLHGVKARIAALDLTEVSSLALAEYRSEHWTSAIADLAEERYRDFLLVCCLWNAEYPDDRLAAVSVKADQMWHCHMLLPRKYRDDCASIFGRGRLLDHIPFPDKVELSAQDLKKSEEAYALAGLPQPPDVRRE